MGRALRPLGLFSALLLLRCSLIVSTDDLHSGFVARGDAGPDAEVALDGAPDVQDGALDVQDGARDVDASDDANGGRAFCVSLEAESGFVTLPMQVGSDPRASGGTYVFTPVDSQGSVAFTFSVLKTASFLLEARVFTGSTPGGQNSFFVGVDGEPAAGDESYAFHTLETTTSWTWDAVSRFGASQIPETPEFDPKVWNLAAGSHTFTFYGRESYTLLDRVALIECPAGGCSSVPDADCP